MTYLKFPAPGLRPRARLLSLLILSTATILPAATYAQAPLELPPPGETVYEFRLGDDTTIYARITELDADKVVLTTVGGAAITIGREGIVEFSEARGRVHKGRFWPEDPAGTRLFFTSTGRSLRQGKAYVGTYVAILPFAAVGVTDRITLAAGAPVLLGEFEPFYIAPKVQVLRNPKAQVSLGTLAFFFKKETVGVAYGVGTFGNSDRAVTTGLGFFYAGNDFSNHVALMVGGETRVSRRIKFLTENYVIYSSQFALFSGGLRFMGDRFATEVGAGAALVDSSLQCCLPLLNFNYTFGR